VGKNQLEKQNQSYIIERIPSVKSFSNLGNRFASLTGFESGAASIAEAKHRATLICAFGSCSVKSASAKGFRLRERERGEKSHKRAVEINGEKEETRKTEKREREREQIVFWN
jgi:pantoate kinase